MSGVHIGGAHLLEAVIFSFRAFSYQMGYVSALCGRLRRGFSGTLRMEFIKCRDIFTPSDVILSTELSHTHRNSDAIRSLHSMYVVIVRKRVILCSQLNQHR